MAVCKYPKAQFAVERLQAMGFVLSASGPDPAVDAPRFHFARAFCSSHEISAVPVPSSEAEPVLRLNPA